MKKIIILTLFWNLFACNSEDTGLPDQANKSIPPSSFNFHEISALTNHVKTYIFEWDKSRNTAYYTLCEKNIDYKDNCKVLKDHIIGNSVMYELNTLLTPKLLEKEFFIIAKNGSKSRLSNLNSIKKSEYLKSIGILQDTNIEENAFFGRSITYSQETKTLAIGAFGAAHSKGKVFIYKKQNNFWVQTSELTPNDLTDGARFGISNALSRDGKTLIIGADYYSTEEPGRVYVYKNLNNTWILDTILTQNINSDSFGKYVTISDNGLTIAIASPDQNNSVGAAYLYTKTGEAWSIQSIKASYNDPYGPNRFGSSIDLNAHGDIVAIGSLGEGQTNLGGVYIFKKEGKKWTEIIRLKTPTPTQGKQYHFGQSVSLDNAGTTLAIGAPKDNLSGSVYIFKEKNSNWFQEQNITLDGLQPEDNFGYRVKLSGDGDNLIVSAFTDDSSAIFSDDNLTKDSGAVYLYKKTSSSWIFNAYLKSPLNQKNGHFGLGMDINDDGSQVFIGARREFNQQGRVYLY